MKISLETSFRLLKRVEGDMRRELGSWISGARRAPGAREGDKPLSMPPRLAEYFDAKRQKLARAYADLESAQYGLCKSCKASIAPERLKADPLALICNPCALRHAL